MALTTVVNSPFFERVYPLLRELDDDEKTGPLVLAMLVPYEATDDFRSLVLASEALDSWSLADATSMVLSRLRPALGGDPFKIDTVSILRTHDSAVRLLCESYAVPSIGTAYQAMGTPAMLLGLHDPILLVTRPVAVHAG